MKARSMSVLSIVQKMFPTPSLLSFSAAGVDISDSSLKFIQLIRRHAYDINLEIKKWGDIDIPSGVVERGTVHDVEKLTAVLKEMKDRCGTSYANISLPEERAYLFETTIPVSTQPKDIRGMLEFRLEENVPLSPRDAYFDFSIVGTEPKDNMLRVAVSVYAQETINSYYEACNMAGITALSFEIEAQAIARATAPKESEHTYMIVDFGKTRMGIGIVNKGILMYTSTIEVAGEKLSTDMRSVLGDLPESELTKIKNTKGLLHTKDNEKVAPLIEQCVAKAVEELEIRIHYWDTRGVDQKERQIKKIILCGGSANLFGLPEFFSERLSIPTERAHVWSNVLSLEKNIPPITRRYSYGYATAIGLALKNFM